VSQKFDAVVVGGGPAGCACGIILAKAGLETLIVERGKFAGAKNMWGGAFYGPSLYEFFPYFWEEAPVERYIARHKYSFLTKDAAFSVDFTTKKFGEPPYNGFSVLRSKFDRWLTEKAEQAGAVVATGLEAEDLLWQGNVVSGIKSGGDEIPADVVIACDGVNSILAEKAGLREKLQPEGRGRHRLGIHRSLFEGYTRRRLHLHQQRKPVRRRGRPARRPDRREGMGQ
jgi:electron transfer flavoprotein-quinone oxidoreductase